ncbi:MAG TPA: hypothetical protein PK625_11930, partial [Spirochaetales bacterium]|nr:hypothetical protein [Spirochaetales bacterium]
LAVGDGEVRAEDELMDEVEFDLFLATLDLTALEDYRDEEGFLELDDAAFAQTDRPTEDTQPRDEDIPFAQEYAMLSDEDRERLEELQVVQADGEGEEPADLDVLSLGGVSHYRPLQRSPLSFRPALEELLAIGDSEPADLDTVPSADVIVMVDGVFTLNRTALEGKPEDTGLKTLAEQVLAGPGRA